MQIEESEKRKKKKRKPLLLRYEREHNHDAGTLAIYTTRYKLIDHRYASNILHALGSRVSISFILLETQSRISFPISRIGPRDAVTFVVKKRKEVRVEYFRETNPVRKNSTKLSPGDVPLLTLDGTSYALTTSLFVKLHLPRFCSLRLQIAVFPVVGSL